MEKGGGKTGKGIHRREGKKGEKDRVCIHL